MIVSYCRYQTINLESKAFKAKCAPLVGPLQLLKAVGFVKNEEEQKLLLERYIPQVYCFLKM